MIVSGWLAILFWLGVIIFSLWLIFEPTPLDEWKKRNKWRLKK